MKNWTTREKHRFEAINWILLSFGFSTLYWLLESIRDSIVFHKGSLLHCTFAPDSTSFWLRILVVCIFTLFGVYAQSLKQKIDSTKESRRYRAPTDDVIKVGLGFGLLYWILDSFRDYLLTPDGNFLERLVLPEPMEFWMRILALFILFLFSLYSQSLINQRRRAENLLRESEEHLEQIIQQMPYPILVSAINGDTTMVNKAFLKTFGIASPDRVIGKFNVFQDATIQSSGHMRDIRDAFSGKTVFIPEIVLPTKEPSSDKGEHLILEATLFPVLCNDDHIWRIVIIWKNITNQKLAEKEKNQIQGQLHQAQKMHAIGILAGGIAHDFNNLLTAILGSADMILMEHENDNSLYDDLNEIKKAAQRATNLTRQLLLFSRKAPMGFKAHSLNASVENLQKMIQRLIGEDIQVETNLADGLPTVKADPGTIEQVIMNLVVNARDSMPQGGKVTISTEEVYFSESDCRQMQDVKPGHHVCLSVADTGYGMTPDTMQHIFEPFFTTKEPGCGTGLGLSVVYGIVQQHEGWINVYSHPDVGSVFKIYLPAVFEAPKTGEKKTKNVPSRSHGNGERILVVEDDEDVRNLTISLLGKNGYHVFSAANTDDAMNVFDRENGHFDLILSDVVLPDGTGIELVEKLRADNPDVKALITSGYMDDKSQWPAIQQKGLPYIQKPYELADLLRTIRDVLSPVSEPETVAQ